MIPREFACFPTLVLLLMFALSSCGSETDSNESNTENENISSNQSLKEEVIAIHDEVMPKMGALRSHQKRLIEEAAELETIDAMVHHEDIEIRRHIALELDQAYEDMFVWMRQFRPQLDDMDYNEGRNYLLDQKEKITKVNEDIKAVLSRAEETSLKDVQ